ncbi:pyridine nucleotide-disulfide oxidoreductase [Mesotoga sp. Brook.08.YT.4.2.5.1]|uniref:(2Fe-2S)-binding protein n=1 Tax=unclassified Mesotoga TaxID=1184398 RepID=UPI000C19CE76|nr:MULTISPECIES: (2Fe-2S)-binding protein [unclassified Mesotoga]PNE23287.1 pyridine nucleotide-disulfide oxidoreductase [Mesotoga sp. Brook.08.YT.4.2.5.1]PNS37939.1 pyridine nucleotide-disulfide oxidoreductase [Mesotoga sp. B105.6.4]PVD16963.1 sarcosine oxidase subunit alpha [Mesotoga sp. Brook.08.105.5.1]RAO97406.1 sarcosine oxidase subunit alpha [Mesotoga sp. Brook.08.YT.4.2.5.4.]RDI91244.1 pyridine nucleotide-disulfide oxidoreductase [Mesotoga sp. Brook.08.YT.4.2.5.2.]
MERITEHPLLSFERSEKITFFFEGRELLAYLGESIAAALHANGIRNLRYSPKKNRPQGLFCAIGKCSSCLMEVDGKPNVRTCITPVRPGMKVRRQSGKGEIIE